MARGRKSNSTVKQASRRCKYRKSNNYPSCHHYTLYLLQYASLDDLLFLYH